MSDEIRKIRLWRRHRLTVRINPAWADWATREDRAWMVMEGYLHKDSRLYPARVIQRGQRMLLLYRDIEEGTSQSGARRNEDGGMRTLLEALD